MFGQLHSGQDVSLSLRLRTEGLMEAWVLSGGADAHSVQRVMAELYQEVCGCSAEDAWGVAWREFYPFPQIPAYAERAPVVPSTAD